MTYSVLMEPVIPVELQDGSRKDVGIREAFLRAHEFQDILGDTPLERYAVLRLLIAFAMDMLHPEDSYARQDILNEGCFDEDTFDAYVAECEKDGPRFDLLDPEHPFMQSKYNEALDARAEKSVVSLFHALPKGNNHVFIDHRMEDDHVRTLPEVFRGLCASYVFCVAGAQGYPSSVNNTPPVYVIIVGNNLFETIVLNMVSAAEADPIPYGMDDVPWKQSCCVTPKMEKANVSMIEALTWQPRRITIAADEKNCVSKIYYQQGMNFKGNDLWTDPHVPQFRKKDDSFGTVKPELGRALWRDVGSLLFDKQNKYSRQPLVLKCISNIVDEMPAMIPIRAIGFVTNQAQYVAWYEDELSIPGMLVSNEENAMLFRSDVSFVESIQLYITKSIQSVISPELSLQAKQFFLQQAHDVLFGQAMAEIAAGLDVQIHIEHFHEAIRGIIRDMLRSIVYMTGTDQKSMNKQMETEKQIWISFNKAVKERKENYAG